jgi:hypothetical protein
MNNNNKKPVTRSSGDGRSKDRFHQNLDGVIEYS